jgi:hypothetical protein
MGRNRKVSREKYGEVICLRLLPPVYDLIKKDAAKRELNMTQLIRICIREYYETRGIAIPAKNTAKDAA